MKKYRACYNNIIVDFKTFNELKNSIYSLLSDLIGECGFIYIVLKCKDIEDLKKELIRLEKMKNIKIEIL